MRHRCNHCSYSAAWLASSRWSSPTTGLKIIHKRSFATLHGRPTFRCSGFRTRTSVFEFRYAETMAYCASRAPYLLFTDSDCIFPEDHLEKHLLARKPGVIRAGDCYRLEQDATDRIDLGAINSGTYRKWISRWSRTHSSEAAKRLLLQTSSPYNEAKTNRLQHRHLAHDWKRSTGSTRISSVGAAKTTTWRFDCERPASVSRRRSAIPMATTCGTRPNHRGLRNGQKVPTFRG